MHLPQSALLDRSGISMDTFIASRVFSGARLGGFTLDSARALPQSFAPVFTNLVTVGTPTYVARFSLVRPICFFQIQIVPATTVASTAGTTYVNLPMAATGINGDGSMENVSTLVGIGICAFDIPNSRCYLPTQGATGNTLEVAGWFEAA